MASPNFSENLRTLDSDKLEIRFNESVRRDFLRLHDMLKDHQDFDYDALRHIEDFSNPKLKRGIPVAFTAVIEVFKQVTAFAEKTKNPALLQELETLQTDLSGFGAEKTPLTIVSVSRRR